MLHDVDKEDLPDFKQEFEKPSETSPTHPVPDVPGPGLACSLLLQTWVHTGIQHSCQIVKWFYEVERHQLRAKDRPINSSNL